MLTEVDLTSQQDQSHQLILQPVQTHNRLEVFWNLIGSSVDNVAHAIAKAVKSTGLMLARGQDQERRRQFESLMILSGEDSQSRNPG